MTTIYLANVSYSKCNIASVEVKKETAKQYQLDVKTEKLISGWIYVPHRINKDERNIFHTLEGAQVYCLEKLEEAARGMEKNLARVQQRIIDFRKETGLSENEQAASAATARHAAGISEIWAKDQTEGDRQTDSGG